MMGNTVLYFIDSHTFGGVERVLLTILEGLDRERWNPVVMYPDDTDLGPFVSEARALDVQLRPIPRIVHGRQFVRHGLPFVRALRAERALVFHAHRNSPLSCTYALVGAVLARIPVIVATQQLFMDIPWTRRARYVQRLVSVGVDRYLAVSHDVARQLSQTLSLPQRKVEVIHNAIPLTPFAAHDTQASLRLELTQGQERPIVLSLARLVPHKGHQCLLQAAQQVPEATFVIAGDGPEHDRLAARIREMDLVDRVMLLGYRRDIPELLASSDVFVLSSHVEGLPVSVLEAMAAGKPVVASRIGGTDEAVLHGTTGLLVPPNDPVALADAIRSLIANPQLRAQMGIAGQQRARDEFSQERMIDHLTGVYDQILDRRVRHGR